MWRAWTGDARGTATSENEIAVSRYTLRLGMGRDGRTYGHEEG